MTNTPISTLQYVEEHPWLKEHANRKLLLQNLPEAYRWFRRGGSTPPFSPWEQLIYPSDWHNIVEHLLSAPLTLDLVAALNDLHYSADPGPEAARVWRGIVTDLLGHFRGNAMTFLDKVFDRHSMDQTPAARAERWSKRVRAQKTLIQQINDPRSGKPTYGFSYQWSVHRGTKFGEDIRSLYALPEKWPTLPDASLKALVDQALASVQKQINRIPNEFPGGNLELTHRRLDGSWPRGARPDLPGERWAPAHWSPSGKLLLAPHEFSQDHIDAMALRISEAGFRVAEWLEIPLQPVSPDTREAENLLARVPLGLDDPLGDLAMHYPSWSPRATATATATAPAAAADPRRKFAVPTSFDELPDEEEEEADDVDWEPAVSVAPATVEW